MNIYLKGIIRTGCLLGCIACGIHIAHKVKNCETASADTTVSIQPKQDVAPKLPPWTVICDKKGHYDYTYYDGTIYELSGVFLDRAEAQRDMEALKAIHEDNINGLSHWDEYHSTEKKAVTAIKDWAVCNEQPPQKVIPVPLSKAYLGSTGSAKNISFLGTTSTTSKALILVPPKFRNLIIGRWFQLTDSSKDLTSQAITISDSVFNPKDCAITVDHEPSVAKLPEGKWRISFK